MTLSLAALRQRLHGARRDAGVSLAELLVVSLVATVLLVALGTLVGSGLSASRTTTSHTAATAEARLAMDVVARRLRVAVRPSPSSSSPMLTRAEPGLVEFYASLSASGSTVDQPPTLVRYEMDNSVPARPCLRETLVNTATGASRSSCLAHGTLTPTFTYFRVEKASSYPSPSPAATSTPTPVPPVMLALPLADMDLVASVGFELQVIDPREPGRPVSMQTRVLMGNHHNERT